MRLWHIDLIKYLPDSQLISQWRELNSIYVHEVKHILINYVYNYDKKYLLSYSKKVLKELKNRNFNICKMDNYELYFKDITCVGNERYPEHNDEYFKICFYNLKEKYMRGQKDFTDEVWRNFEGYIEYKKLGVINE